MHIADILIFMYMYRNNIHKCFHTRPTNMQSYRIGRIMFEVCGYYFPQNSNLKSYLYTYVPEVGNNMTMIC